MAEKQKCVIFCGGPESCDLLKGKLDGYFVICADSGYDKAKKLGVSPNLVIGDFDSVQSDLPENVEVIRAPAKKDDTDTLLAVKTALSRGYKALLLAGACGGRGDHLLANIFTLEYIKQQGGNGRIMGDTTCIYLLRGESITLSPDKDSYLSVFSLTDSCFVSINGAEYNLNRYLMTRSYPIGISNEFTDNECVISVKDGTAIAMTVNKKTGK